MGNIMTKSADTFLRTISKINGSILTSDYPNSRVEIGELQRLGFIKLLVVPGGVFEDGQVSRIYSIEITQQGWEYLDENP